MDRRVVADQRSPATAVVLMRDGTRTVMTIESHYVGPIEDFSLVLPVPNSFRSTDASLVPIDIVARLDALSVPRLSEVWEADPCGPDPARVVPPTYPEVSAANLPKVTAAANGKFSLAEYQLSLVNDGHGGTLLVVKLDAKHVKRDNDDAVVFTPLRLVFESSTFAVPIALASKINQDLVVEILADGQRYQVGNAPNAAMPTNLIVRDDVHENFEKFYAELFTSEVAKNPKAVETEFARAVPMNFVDLAYLSATPNVPAPPSNRIVLTRLRVRVSDALKADLDLQPVAPIVGGGDQLGPDGKLDQTVSAGSVNDFQSRYVIRHPWMGPTTCSTPRRQRWGAAPRDRYM